MSQEKYLNLDQYINKVEGDPITDTIWNGVFTAIETAVNGLSENNNEGNTSGGSTDSHIIFDGGQNGKHNLTIQTTAEDQYLKNGETKGGKINLEPISDLQIKSGDDVILCSHHREDPTEVSLKIHDGEDHPVKLQVNVADIVLTTKDKNKTKTKDENKEDTDIALYDDPTVLNISVNSAKNTKGYLKVRARAIDLRCEDHGGIALQPKGEDSDHHMNKIKFEHGGGDGLEFGTFNTEHTSLFTEDYRFNKDGIIKLATRQIEVSDKPDPNDPTTAYKYVKNTNDDFYDFIRSGDPSCTWADIVSYISWLKSTHQGIFQAGLILSTGLANSEDGLPQIKILCGSNKSVTAQKIVDRASNITTTINGTTYNLTATLYGSQLRFTTQYNNHEVVVFMQQNSSSGTQNLPEGLKLYTFSLSYDPVSSLNASTAKLTIGNFDFVGLF